MRKVCLKVTQNQKVINEAYKKYLQSVIWNLTIFCHVHNNNRLRLRLLCVCTQDQKGSSSSSKWFQHFLSY